MGARPDPLRRYLDLLVQSLDESVRGPDIARRAYLSRFHFDRLVRSAAREPPGALRRRLLLERAAFRLTRSTEPVTDVGLEAGYATPSAFARAFRLAFRAPPSKYRRRAVKRFWLPSPNGVHFHPPAGLILEADRRTKTMDLTERLVEHDLWLTDRLLERAETLSDEQLDAPIGPGGPDLPEVSAKNLRGLLGRLVSTKEVWTASIEGRTLAEHRDASIEGLRRRLREIGPEFRQVVRGISEHGSWETAFVDALCDPPETFTFGGAIAHVITFSAYRRELALGALRRLGVGDLGYGDPIEWERARAAGDA